MNDCIITTTRQKELIINVLQQPSSLVMVEQKNPVIRAETCCNKILQTTERDPVMQSVERRAVVIQVEKTTAIVQFPECIEINNTPLLPPAQQTGSVINTYEAGDQVNVNRAVVLQPDGRVVHADPVLLDDGLDIIGVAHQSGAIGSLIEVVEFGKLTGANLSSIGDNFYLGANGVLSTVPVSSGWWIFIGTQLRDGEIFVNMSEPIRRQ